jgi:4-amino-4-deoxy-L-arabinose transferase-like glycosyltransferase
MSHRPSNYSSSSSSNNNTTDLNTGNGNINSSNSAATHGLIDDQGFSQIYAVDYSSNRSTASTTAPTSPTTTLYSAHHSSNGPTRGASPSMGFSNMPLPSPTKWKRFRLRVMKMATVERLQLLWALLAILGTISWIALMPAFGFRYERTNKQKKKKKGNWPVILLLLLLLLSFVRV